MARGKSFSTLIQKQHLHTVRALGYILTLGTQEAWLGFIPVLKARLTLEETAALCFAAIRSLDHENASMTVEAVLSVGAGQPQAPLFSLLDQAAFWVDLADPAELDAYCLACFEAMEPSRQHAFLDFFQGRKAA